MKTILTSYYALPTCICFLLSLIPVTIWTQPSFPVSEGFNVTGCATSPCGGTIDDDGCLPAWSTAFGTPRISSNSPIEGTRSLNLVAVKDDDSNWGTEGVYWQIADFFEEDSCYQITCYVRYVGGSNAAETSIQFELATGLNAVTSFSNLNCPIRRPPRQQVSRSGCSWTQI